MQAAVCRAVCVPTPCRVQEDNGRVPGREPQPRVGVQPAPGGSGTGPYWGLSLSVRWGGCQAALFGESWGWGAVSLGPSCH